MLASQVSKSRPIGKVSRPIDMKALSSKLANKSYKLV